MERNCAGITLGAEFSSVPVFPHGVAGIFVSEGARIGKNCVVTRDVPDNATVVSEKPRMLIREKAQDNTFVPFAQV